MGDRLADLLVEVRRVCPDAELHGSGLPGDGGQVWVLSLGAGHGTMRIVVDGDSLHPRKLSFPGSGVSSDGARLMVRVLEAVERCTAGQR